MSSAELSGDPARAGVLMLTQRSIDTRFVAYSERLCIDTEGPIHLRTEHNDIVSLHGNVSSGPGRTFKNTDPPLATQFQEVTSTLPSSAIGRGPKRTTLSSPRSFCGGQITRPREQGSAAALVRVQA